MYSVKQVGILLVALACVAGAAGLPNQRPALQDGSAPASGSVRAGGLLDFANYKRLFNKSYSGLLEETVRWKYFTASGLQTVASAISYKLRRQNHYSALNDMSDYSPEEFDMMENKVLAAEWANEEGRAASTTLDETSPEFMPGDRENITSGLRELAEEHKGDPGYAELEELLSDGHEKVHERRKRDTIEPTKNDDHDDGTLPPRELPIDELFNTGPREADQLSPGVRAKLRNFVPSNNPKYQPVELTTQGLKDTQREVKWHSFESDSSAILNLGKFLANLAVGEIDRKIMPEMAHERAQAAAKSIRWAARKPDEVFQDLRTTNCFAPIRCQGKCGSCYAFAGIALLEFLYCRATGQLVPFSEQYIMDCGKANMNRLKGCEGGNPVKIGHFVRNFGLHLRSMYPYTAREGTCPYDSDTTEFEQTGYIRSDSLSHSLIVSHDFWPDVLRRGPLMICIATSREFKHYRDGVFMGSSSAEAPPRCTHMVVVIGHGREGGREYWLIRNSWGTKWGDGGYGKIDKESAFIPRKFGFMLGVKRPKRITETKFVENESHDNSLLNEAASREPYVKIDDKPAQEFQNL